MTNPLKLFVLDTNVLIHDPSAFYRFKEHDVYIPIVVLEELDAHKTGVSEVARNARQASRFLDEILSSTNDLASGALLPTSAESPAGRLFIPLKTSNHPLPEAFTAHTTDNQLLALIKDLAAEHTGRDVILVSKDINLRIKARALGLNAEDYTSDRVLDDADLLYRGIDQLAPEVSESLNKAERSGELTQYEVQGPATRSWYPNEFLVDADESLPAVVVRELSPDHATLQNVRDYATKGGAIWGIRARNIEQNFALNLLMDPEIDFVTLLGHAGTGKTLLTLAAALHQTIEQQRYTDIIVTRITIPVGNDIGFLPGTEEEKMGPWMGALDDNLDVLNQAELESRAQSQWARAAATDLIRSRIHMKSLNFMRGRTFLRKFIIVDEAQNLSAHQMKTLITRAGPGTKVVCLGNIAQIDSPYLTETTSGITYVVDRFKQWKHSGHVTLRRGERSRLADMATDIL
ncbi:MAG TPA: PhoH family protein [Acidiferrobacter sp.]|nr:PhoH family protein [Acidiferrobacter sp.]